MRGSAEPWHAYWEQTRNGLAILATARELGARYGQRVARNYIISHTETLSDLIEVMLLQKEAGMLQGTLGSKSDPARMELMVIPLKSVSGELFFQKRDEIGRRGGGHG